jgi:phosphotransferase family enzyme
VTPSVEPGALYELLARHGLSRVTEEPFPNDGWSGASMTLLRRRDGVRFVLKRDSPARDWIATATADGPLLREAWFADRRLDLPAPIRAPYLGAAADPAGGAGGVAILMPDLSGVLFDWDAPISADQLERVLDGLARLHAGPWDEAAELAGGPWCPLRERLTLICRPALERPGAARDAVGDRILPGWDAFDRLAPAAAHDLVASLGADPGPLLRALDRLPRTLLHGDLKLANVGLSPDGSIDLVDWQMVTVAPVAVELGWFLVSNVASLPLRPDDVLARYRAKATELGAAATLGDWPAQVDTAILVGLLLRGWRKGMDAEQALILPTGRTAAEDLGWWCDRAIEAAARVL